MEARFFLVWRRSGGNLTRREPGNRRRLPRYRHTHFESALREAERLSEKHPESRFVVLSEVAVVGPHISGDGDETPGPVLETGQ